MKITKLSLAALAVAGFASSAMAMDLSSVTVKPYAQAKLYYEATDMNDNDMFHKDAASGQALLTAGVSGKFDSCWGYGFEYMVADTLGLEGNLVSNTRMGYGRASAGRYGEYSANVAGLPGTKAALVSGLTETQHWASQAYVTYSPCNTILSNTTFKIGRQYLDTPLAFTERWNLAPNSFDAIVAINQDIKNVTLVGAYVGRGNGMKVRVTSGDDFNTYAAGKGAYAVGALTKFVDGLPINLWYYDLPSMATAAWADAAYNLKLADDMAVGIGAQYGTIMPAANGVDDTVGYGVKLSGKIGMFDVMAAYTTMDDDGAVALANTATMSGTTGGKKTKLYTANIYTDGTAVAVPGSDAWKVRAAVKVDGIGKFIAQYNSCENDVTNAAMQNVDELDVIYATKLAGINTKLIYMNRSVTEGAVANAGLKDDTNHFRVILAKNF